MSRYLTDLADICRTSGLVVTEVDGWKTRGHGPQGSTAAVVCHHTGSVTAPTGNYPSLGTVRDGRSDLPGPLAHLGLARDGSVLVIAAGMCYHAGVGRWPGLLTDSNDDKIGIEAESVGNGLDWTAAQRDAYPRLCAALSRGYRIPTALVLSHAQWAQPPGRKTDPVGIDMPTLRSTVTAINSAPLPVQEDDMPYSDWPQKDRDMLLNDIANFAVLGRTIKRPGRPDITLQSFVASADDVTDGTRAVVLKESDIEAIATVTAAKVAAQAAVEPPTPQ